jgi:hypothetical protein
MIVSNPCILTREVSVKALKMLVKDWHWKRNYYSVVPYDKRYYKDLFLVFVVKITL